MEMMTRRGRYNLYRRTDVTLLSYSASLDLQKSVAKVLEALNSPDDTVVRETLKALDEGYRAMLKVEIKTDLPCYASMLAALLINHMKVLTMDTYDKLDIIYQKDYSLEMDVCFYQRFCDLYKAYENRTPA